VREDFLLLRMNLSLAVGFQIFRVGQIIALGEKSLLHGRPPGRGAAEGLKDIISER
jgi:hypothetical protein